MMTEFSMMVIFGMCGFAAVIRGAWLLSPALGWMAAGATCLFVAFWPLIRERILR